MKGSSLSITLSTLAAGSATEMVPLRAIVNRINATGWTSFSVSLMKRD
jgi:hypothetical protein